MAFTLFEKVLRLLPDLEEAYDFHPICYLQVGQDTLVFDAEMVCFIMAFCISHITTYLT